MLSYPAPTSTLPLPYPTLSYHTLQHPNQLYPTTPHYSIPWESDINWLIKCIKDQLQKTDFNKLSVSLVNKLFLLNITQNEWLSDKLIEKEV